VSLTESWQLWEGLDVDFRALHLQLLYLLDEGTEDMDDQQDSLDKHDDNVASLSVQLKQLILSSTLCIGRLNLLNNALLNFVLNNGIILRKDFCILF
jgi:hypothetical protein